MPDKIYPKSALQLPNEILAIIINELASEDEENSATLASCRLASHVLCSLATPLFFSSVWFTDITGNKNSHFNASLLVERATKLNEVLTIHNIAASVRTLTLCCHYYETFESSIICTLLSAILLRLPHIRNFTLEAVQAFPAIPESFARAIQTFCRSPDLTTLSLKNIQRFPFTAITVCPNLRCLRLQGVVELRFNDVNLRDETLNPQLLDLNSLEIDDESIYTLRSRILEDLSIAKHLSRIKNLQLKGLFCNALILDYGWHIIRQASQTLTTLELMDEDRRPEGVLDGAVFDWGQLLALRHFKIQLQSSRKHNPPRFLTQLLSFSSSSTSIEILEIGITWHGVREGYGKDLFSSDEWSALDQLLTSHVYGSLSKVVLRLRLWMDRRSAKYRERISELEGNFLSYINGLLPLFEALTRRTLETHLEAFF